MSKKTSIAVIAAAILLITGGIAFAQSSGNGEQKRPFNLDQNYPRPNGCCCYGH